MKKIIVLLFVTLTYSSVQAQCDKMFDFRDGTSWTWANYDKKGKLLGKTIQKVEDFSIDGANRTAVISMTRADNKGEQTEPISLEMSCIDGVIVVDMEKFLPTEYMEGEDSQMSVDTKNLEIPSSLNVGDKLKDGSITMSMTGSSPIAMNVTVTISDRKVLDEETLNTPAGEFDCLVMEQTISTKMMMTIVMKSKEWYAPGIGTIKSESYNKKGKLTGYTMLTAFSR